MEKTTIYICSLKNFKLIGKFGKVGEGSGELKYIPNDRPMNLFFTGGDITVNCLKRLFVPLLYSIHKDRFYSLIKDEEDEIWKVHSMDLNL